MNVSNTGSQLEQHETMRRLNTGALKSTGLRLSSPLYYLLACDLEFLIARVFVGVNRGYLLALTLVLKGWEKPCVVITGVIIKYLIRTPNDL